MSNETVAHSFNTLGIVGTGAMGRGIAQLAAQAGLNVLLFDVKEGAVTEATAFITGLWQRSVEKQRMTQAQSQQYSESVTDPATIDRIMVDQGGFRMGPFTLLDLIGLDVSHAVMESVYQQYYEEPRFRPSPLTRQRLSAGLLGRKTGEGFYHYVDGQQQIPAEPTLTTTPFCPVWISQDDPGSASQLAELINAAGWPLERAASPSAEALCLLTPLGEGTTQCALRQGLNAQPCVAVDMLAGLNKRRSLMTSPITRPDVINTAISLLSTDGTPVSTLQDSNGFVLQRVVACIVNVGADIAQQGVADPAA